MPTYRFCDLALESNIAIDELSSTHCDSPHIRFHFESGIEPAGPESEQLFRSQTRNGRVWMDVGRIDGDPLLRFPGLGEFRISADASQILGRAPDRTPLPTVRHLLLDQVLPLALSCQAELVLHAGAVESSDGAAVFIGKSGAGKSTLAASLARTGHPLISDDFLILRNRCSKWFAHPSYPGLRLWPDSAEALFGSAKSGTHVAHYTPKRRCGLEPGGVDFAIEPSRLKRIYVVSQASSERVVITSLTPRAAFAELIHHCYRLDIDDRAFLRRQFGALTQLSERPIFRRLAFPRNYSKLTEVRRAIHADLEARASRR